MSFVMISILVILIIEVLLVVILCAPLPWGVRKNVARFLLKGHVRQRVITVLRYVGFGLIIALIESITTMNRLDKRINADDTDSKADPNQGLIAVSTLKIRLIQAERNMYMSSFSLVLIVVLGRLIYLVSNEMELKNKIKSLTGKDYEELTEEKKSLAAKSQ